MKFLYDNTVARLYDNKYVNVIQAKNPYNNTDITNKEEALEWAKQYLLEVHDSNLIYFELELVTDNEEELLITNKKYNLKLKETTGRLTGKYNITINSENETISKEAMFADGEASIDILFKYADIYEVMLEVPFYIGQDKYLTLIDESDVPVTISKHSNSINHYKIIVADKE